MNTKNKQALKNVNYLDARGVPLDKYEEEIEMFLETGNYKMVDNFDEDKRELEEAAKKHIELQESKSITLRVKRKDLILVKAKARRKNIPYQTLINLLINHYVENKVSLTV